MKDMLADLNQLLAKHARGQDTPEDFQEFMAKHGDLFPENPQNVDELIDALARRAAAGQRLMASLTPQQRDELQQLMSQALGDADLAAELSARTSAGTGASGPAATPRSATARPRGRCRSWQISTS
jgi:uncharacterized protein with von Willebrand factor type A (vWA) domain